MTQDRDWTTLYRIGGIAALVAAVLFRRNIGAEVSLFTGVEAIPQTAAGWFTLLQNNPLTGLAFLALFDVVNYALVGLMFLALAALFWLGHRVAALVALATGATGIAVSFATNIALTMLSLSQKYAAAASDAQKVSLAMSGQAILAFHDPLAVYPATGPYLSILLIALAGLLFSVAMFRGRLFGRATPLAGLLAASCDLAYCFTFAFAPSLRAYLMAAGGLFWMIWHLLIGIKLLRVARRSAWTPYPDSSSPASSSS